LLIDDPRHDGLTERIDAELMRTSLAALQAETRIPIELGFFDGMTPEDIAKRISTPIGAVKTRIRDGLHQLRKTLENEATG
jgi:RNA polymerase sigma-70 factor (ECF subfamily)